MSSKEGLAWAGVLSHPLPGRSAKPRTTGLTMVLDKGMGLNETESLLQVAAEYVDYLKLGFGTSALYTREFLDKKLRLAATYGVGVYPGGTSLEVAVAQGKLVEYLRKAHELGFRCLEVSDGTIEMNRVQRNDIITRARDAGFDVITEVGKKDASIELSGDFLAEEAVADLAAGASKVIVEGRESGKGVGVYDSSGGIREDSMECISGQLPMQHIIWEAPLKPQQEALIVAFGPNVNLGNIATTEVVALEAMRVGLRGDTLKFALERGLGFGDKQQ